jgi:hypothetical protein
MPRLEIPRLETEGPFGSTLRLEASERIRQELVNWFDPLPTAAATNSRYGFLGNRFQLGLRIARDPVEVFAQLQHSLLLDLPRNAVGPGGTKKTLRGQMGQKERGFRMDKKGRPRPEGYRMEIELREAAVVLRIFKVSLCDGGPGRKVFEPLGRCPSRWRW